MKDRIPTHVGRVQLVPVAGQTNIYDMTMADDPVEVGTPLNKATLLKDATAALFGLTSSAVPDDVFAAIAAQNTAQIDYGSYTGNGQYGSANAVTLTFPFEPKLVIVLSEDKSFFGPSGSGNIYSTWLMAINGVTKVYVGYYSNTEVVVSWGADSISYYATSASAGAQCNELNKKYYYIALG